jgi:esterase/lipase superfamily enzyme
MLFARDGLEQLLRALPGQGLGRIVLVGHSLGSAVIMETLRQIELEQPGWAGRALGGVVLISPDLDPQVFRQQITRLDPIPEPFVLFVSGQDRALSLSGFLRGNENRLGSIQNLDGLADLPIEIIDTTAFSKGAESSHFIPATSPALIAMLGDARRMSGTFGTESRGIDALLSQAMSPGGSASRIVLSPTGSLR